VSREELERVLREELHLNEVAPGVWVGRTTIPGLTAMQPFLIMVRLLDHAVAVAINLGLQVDRNHEAVYEYLLEVNGRIALGEFFVDDEDRISMGAEMPCREDSHSYFSQEELVVMMKVLFDAVKDHYNRILQLIHGGERRGPRDLLSWLKTARERR